MLSIEAKNNNEVKFIEILTKLNIFNKHKKTAKMPLL